MEFNLLPFCSILFFTCSPNVEGRSLEGTSGPGQRAERTSPAFQDVVNNHLHHHLIIRMNKEGNRLASRPSSKLLFWNHHSVTSCREPGHGEEDLMMMVMMMMMMMMMMTMTMMMMMMCYHSPPRRKILQQVSDVDKNRASDRIRREPVASD